MKEHNDSSLGKHLKLKKEFQTFLTVEWPSTCHIYVHQKNKPFFVDFLLCDFSLTAKSLVSRLMEVDQDQRLTAQEAINHEW